jgi:hypothetical protein
MKVVFLLDNKEYVEVAPDKLQIRQITSGQAALGNEVTVPVNKEDGTPELNEDGTPKTQVGFRPFINYAVNLLPVFATADEEITYLTKLLADKKAAAALPAPAAVVAEPVKKSNGKAKVVAKSKRKAN